MPSSESGGVGSGLRLGCEESGDVTGEDDLQRPQRAASGGVIDGCEGGSADTTISEAPDNHTRGTGTSSRQLLSNISATVQLMPKLGGVPTGSANADVSRRDARAGSIESAFLCSDDSGNENERRNVSMLSRRRFATEFRGRGGSRCTRWALVSGTCEQEHKLLSESSEPRGVGGIK